MSEGEASLAELPRRLEVAPKVDVLFVPSSALLPDTLQPQGQERCSAQDTLSKKRKTLGIYCLVRPISYTEDWKGVLLMEKEKRDLLQKSIQLIWEGTDLPKDTAECRSEIQRQVFVLMQCAHVGTHKEQEL